MKRLFTILFITAFSLCLNAQTYKWEWQNPKPQGNDFNDIVLLGANNVLAVGNAGVLQMSTDGGSKWTISYIDSAKRDLQSIYFIDNSKGIIAGKGGLLLKTTDAGKTWKSLNSGTVEDLNDVEFVNADTGYAVGSKGTILKTKDGGNTWVYSTFGTSSIYKVNIASASAVYLGTGNSAGRIAKSVDYGATWKSVTPTAITSSIYALYFLNDSTGFAGTSDDNVFKTTDGGTTWTKKTNFSSNTIYDVKFISPTEGYAVDSKGNVIKSTDAGETWTAQRIPLQKFNAFAGNSTAIYAVGVAGAVYKSEDKGTTWNAKFSFVVQQYLRQIIFTDKNTGYVCGGSTAAADSLGYILKTTDGGATWTQLPFNFKTQMYTLAMPTADVWYVAGGANSIFKTTDGGKTFVKQTSPVTTATHVYWTSAFVNKDLGYIGGVSGKLVKTTDGGTTWKEVTSNFGTSSIFKMAMPDTGTLIMGGLNAKLSKTTDGGATWTALTPGISGTIFSMKFKDSKFGYIGANNAGVAKTTDGGNTWIPQTLPQSVSTNATVWSLAFSDSAVWAITGNGEICKIGNKDTLWTVASKFVTTPLSDIEAKGNDLWVVGNNGVIIKGTPEVTSAVGENNIAVCNFDLMQNYPNPFNPATTIKYTIPAEGKVSLKIYNVLGKEVAQLINQNQSAGQHSVSFNASELSSGVYFYQLTFGSNVSVKKMMLVK